MQTVPRQIKFPESERTAERLSVDRQQSVVAQNNDLQGDAISKQSCRQTRQRVVCQVDVRQPRQTTERRVVDGADQIVRCVELLETGATRERVDAQSVRHLVAADVQ